MDTPAPGMLYQPERLKPDRTPQYIGIIGVLIVIAAIGAAAYLWLWPLTVSHLEPAVNIEFINATTTAWYSLKGDALTRITAPPDAPAPLPMKGPGRALGKLPNGDLLALTSLGLSRVKSDGEAFQILHAGGDGSTAPIGAASSDLSLVAFENQTTHEIAVYRFDRTTLSPVFMGIASPVHSDATAIAPAGYGYIGDASSSRRMLIRIDAEGLIPISRFPNGTTKQEQKAWSGRLLEPSSSPSVVPVAAAITANTLLVEWSPGGFSAYAISQENVGPAVPLSIVDNE